MSSTYYSRGRLSNGIEILMYLTGDVHNPGIVERQCGDSAAIVWQLQDMHAGE